MAYALKDHPLVGKTAYEIAALIDQEQITPAAAVSYLKAKKRLSLQARLLVSLCEEGLPIGQYEEVCRQATADVFKRKKERIEKQKAEDAERKRKRAEANANAEPEYEPGSPEDIKARVQKLQEALTA